ncbi:hypothetical protein [Thermomonospora echinospora]|uniref:hypothetical protein n=1 Tax=Thermomonospora echinospora TaxID=1992 RepID=UPI000CDF03D9|nr:hypothetical protein [Thermomonospora echinospora]
MGILLARLVDDAALLPPAREPMRTALPAYRTAAGHPLLGRFLCPASRLDELRRRLVPEDLIDLGIIADTGVEHLPTALETVRREPRVRLRSVEISPAPDADQARAAAVVIARLPADLPCLIEVRRMPGWRETLDRLAAARGRGVPLGAKLRTVGTGGDGADGRSNGVTEQPADGAAKRRADGAAANGRAGGEHGPSPAEVAAFVVACAERDLPFTCTAGLHRAVRHVDPATGLAHHGFLNIVVAACRARSGASGPGAVDDAVASTDAIALAEEAAGVDDAAARAARELFVAFGSCDIETPRSDLIKLGLAGEGTVT